VFEFRRDDLDLHHEQGDRDSEDRVAERLH
jgi:hypothetical protein